MGLPKEIWICGQRCTIKSRPNSLFGVYGVVAFAEGLIEIMEGIPEAFQRETLLHEIIHCVDYCLGSGDVNLTRFLEGEINRLPSAYKTKLREPEVIFLSRGLWWTLSDPRNKDVTEWLFQSE